MPRKKVLGPATASQVLAFYETASEDAIDIVSDLVNGVLSKRFTKGNTGQTTGAKRPSRRKPAAAAPAPSLAEA